MKQEKNLTNQSGGGLLHQPGAVWAVAFSCVIAFMGIGLVDPILPALAEQLNASNSQVELLFTSYILVTGAVMIITDVVSSRFGIKKTMLVGLFLIVIFSGLAGLSGLFGHLFGFLEVGQTGVIYEIIGFRGGWGFGNALFIATALAAIVGSARGSSDDAIILYEAALGLGISVGPLLGGLLGGISWRGPFFGVAVLMAIGFIAVVIFLKKLPHESREPRPISAPFKALGHRGLLTVALTALFYNYGFFTLLAFTPLVLGLSAHMLGLIFFGWGVMVALTSVFVAPKLHKKFGVYPSLFVVLLMLAVILLIMGLNISSNAVLIVAVIISGAFLGINNTLVTTAVMKVSDAERSVASASYSFVRFMGGGIAPWLAGVLSQSFNEAIPFYVGTAGMVISILILTSGRKYLRTV
ncbi:MAG TPA: MFS transporter [Bacillales bacterium]|nr:MFS transporter [Bacillales bacterium]